MYLGGVHICWRWDRLTIGCRVLGNRSLLDWCICDVIGWSCGRLRRANRLVTAGGGFGSVIVRVVSRHPTDCYIGMRW